MPRETGSSAKRIDPAPDKPQRTPAKRHCARGSKPQEPSSEVPAASQVGKRSLRSTRSSEPSSSANPLPLLPPPPSSEELPLRRTSEVAPKAPKDVPSSSQNPNSLKLDSMAERQPNTGDEGEGELGRNLTAANSALEGLLRSLGAVHEDWLPGMMGGGGRIKQKLPVSSMMSSMILVVNS
eukprot:gene7519-666_t